MTRGYVDVETPVRHPETGEITCAVALLREGRAVLYHTNVWYFGRESNNAWFVNLTDISGLAEGETTGYRISHGTFDYLRRRGYPVIEHDGYAKTGG